MDMKKFIITFNYKGFALTAKVFIHKHGNTIVYSTQLIEDHLAYMFEDMELIFSKEPEGYRLMLFRGATRNKPHHNEMLDWHIKTEFIDNAKTLYKQTFSMS
jgi:hypothetical protein